MNPHIRFKYGQVVWVNSQVKAKEFRCKALKIICTYNGYSADEWGQTAHGNGGMPFRIYYSDVPNPKETEWTSEELLFETKEDLLKSL
jgi:hypothetical protein